MQLDAHIPPGPIAEKWNRLRAEMKLLSPNNKRKFRIIVVGSGLAGLGFFRRRKMIGATRSFQRRAPRMIRASRRLMGWLQIRAPGCCRRPPS